MTVKMKQTRTRRTIRRSALLALGFVVALSMMPSKAYAQCTSPASPAGGLQYFSGTTDYRYCDGTNWIAWGSGSGGLWSDDTTHISYQSTHLIKTGQALPAIMDDDGTRMFFYPDKHAFRGGAISGGNNAWQDANIGTYSFAYGINAEAAGTYSTAMGSGTTASGAYSTARGRSTTASGSSSTALGWSTSAGGTASFAVGDNASAGGDRAMSIGFLTSASGTASVALGNEANVSGDYSMAIGIGNPSNPDPVVSGTNSLGIFMGDQTSVNMAADNTMAVVGGDFIVGSYQLDDTTNSAQDYRMFFDRSKGAFRAGWVTDAQWDAANVGNYSAAFGVLTTASGQASTALGWNTLASNSASLATGENTTASGQKSTAMGQEVKATGTQHTFAIGLSDQTGTDADRPQVSGEGSLGVFMDFVSNYNLSTTDTFGIIGGELMIDSDGTTAASKGCIQFNDTSDELEYSDDCSTYTAFSSLGGGSGLWTDNTTHISYESTHIIKGGQTLPATMDDDGTRMFYYGDKSAFRGGAITFSDNAWQDANIGNNSFAYGDRAEASGAQSTAFGDLTTASGENSFAAGQEAAASGINSSAIGSNATASANNSHALGVFVTASGEGSIAMGEGTTASGPASTAMGRETTAAGDQSTAMGYQVNVSATGDGGMGIGLQTAAQTTDPIVSGARSLGIFMDGGVADANSGIDMTAADTMALIGGDFIVGSYQLDDTTTGNQDNRMFFDRSNSAFRAGTATGNQWDVANSGQYSAAFGINATASGVVSIAMGSATTASGDYSTAMGRGTTASGDFTTATGDNSTASGYSSTAMGYYATASGDFSTATGDSTTASGVTSTAIGDNSTASGSRSVAIGQEIKATATNTMAIGLSDQTNTDANRPQVSGAGSLGVFMDTVDSYNLSTTDTFGIIGGELMIDSDGTTAASKGCIQFNDTSDELEYSDDCSTYTAFSSLGGGGSGLWTDDTTHISYQSVHFINNGQALPAALDDSGTRMFFYPDKSAFRGGQVTNTSWQESNIGDTSFAFGLNARASGDHSVSFGARNVATGDMSVAFGEYADATAQHAIAMGRDTTASGNKGVAIGNQTTASGTRSTSLGYEVTASGTGSFAIGLQSGGQATHPVVSGDRSLAIFMDGGVANANSGYNFTDTDTMALIGGKLLIDSDASSAASRGCIQFNDTSDKLEFSHDCSTYSEFGTASSMAINDLTDAFTDYVTDNNLIMGRSSAAALTAGAAGNVFVGQGAGATSANSTAATDSNTALGYNALTALTSGQLNTAIGNQALTSNTTGTYNTALGAQALQDNVNGLSNMAVGHRALLTNVAKSNSTAVGYEAMRYADSTGTASNANNTAVGYQALRGSTTATANTGTANTALGKQAGYLNTTGSSNIFIGANAGYNNATGTRNIFIGNDTAWEPTASNDNVFIGDAAGNYTDGHKNTAVGVQAMNNIDDGNVDMLNVAIGYRALQGDGGFGGSGLRNVAIGAYAGNSVSDGDDNILIGYDIDLPTAGTDNYLSIGNTIYGDLSNDLVGIGQVPASGVELDVLGDIEYTGELTDVSDRRLKENINPLNKHGALIDKLQQIDTYSFNMIDNPDGRTEFGVMAQELEQVFPELVRTAEDEMGTKSVNYTGLIAPMIEATKELKSENDALRSEIESLKSAQGETTAALQDLSQQVALLNKAAGNKVNKASSLPLNANAWLLVLLGLLSGAGAALVITRKTAKAK